MHVFYIALVIVVLSLITYLARKFHELNQAHELLLDPLRRMALDAKMRLQQARKARYASFDAKRKGLVEELEERERAFKKAKLDKEAEQKERIRQNERIMEEGRILREEKEKQLRAKEVEREESEKKAKICEQSNGADEDEPPTLGAIDQIIPPSRNLSISTGSLDTTVRVKYSLSSHPTLTSPASLIPLLSPFGPLDSSSILISLRPSPPKKSKRGTAVVPFTQIGGAFAAVCASGRMESGMGDIEICWAGGKEPELIGWLKKMGKLGGTGTSNKDPKSGSDHVSAPSVASKSPPPTSDTPDVAPTPQPASTTYSTFPSTFVRSFLYVFTDNSTHLSWFSPIWMRRQHPLRPLLCLV